MGQQFDSAVREEARKQLSTNSNLCAEIATLSSPAWVADITTKTGAAIQLSAAPTASTEDHPLVDQSPVATDEQIKAEVSEFASGWPAGAPAETRTGAEQSTGVQPGQTPADLSAADIETLDARVEELKQQALELPDDQKMAIVLKALRDKRGIDIDAILQKIENLPGLVENTLNSAS